MDNIIPKGYIGFAICHRFRRDVEALAISSTCILNQIPCKLFEKAQDVPADYIPVGDIRFCEDVLWKKVKPDYYPEYLKNYLHRKVWGTNEWPLGRKVFIKPADSHKRFTGFITNGGYKGKKRPPYICSEVIEIVDEWRYYICQGEVLYANWYAGIKDEEIEPPKLDIKFDKELCCCLDMGIDEQGQLILIEQQSPYACGWYGKTTPEDNAKYAKWIAYGWDYLKRNLAKS